MTKWDDLTEEERLHIEYPRLGAEADFATGDYDNCWGFDYNGQIAYYVTDEGTRVITFTEAHEPPDDPLKGLVRFFAEEGRFNVDVPDGPPG